MHKVTRIIILLLCSTNLFVFVSNAQYGESHSCQHDIFCVPDWCDQRRSVVLIEKLIDGVYAGKGSGALINNVLFDGKPYLLTAKHLVDSDRDDVFSVEELEALDTWKLIFNYQIDHCANHDLNPEPSKSEFLIGVKFLSSGPAIGGDWILLELVEEIPSDYNVYFSGFNAFETIPKGIACIHHPRSDVKKWSYSNKKAKEKTYNWYMKKWQTGTIEGGSSGAPWYQNDSKLIVAVQSNNTGNGAFVCNQNKIKASGARIDVAWEAGTAADEQLKHWLNSINASGVIGILGYDPCKPFRIFNNANDLHTSINVDPILPYTGPTIGTRSHNGVYNAADFISVQNSIIQTNTSVEFYAEKVHLREGFKTTPGAKFKAAPIPCLGGCGNGKALETDTMMVFFSDTIQEQNGLEKVSSALNFKVYPNPSSGFISVEIEKPNPDETINVILRNMVGQIVHTSVSSSEKIDLDLTNIPSGVYIIEIKTSSETRTKKLIRY